MARGDDIIKYTPNVAANVIVGVIYVILGVVFSLKIHQNKNKWALCLPIGVIASAIGYFCRLAINPKNVSLGLFVVQNLLIIATPSAFLAFNYMLYGRFIASIDPQLGSYESQSRMERSRFSFIPPRIVGRGFIISDICTFLIQVTAGSMMGSAGDVNRSLANIGDKLFIVGVAAQGVTYAAYTALVTVAFWRLSAERRKERLSLPTKDSAKLNRDTAVFIGCLYFSSVFITIRSVYRVVEFVQGHDGYLISKEGNREQRRSCLYMFVLDAVPLMLGIGIWALVWPPVVLEKIAVQVRGQGETMKGGQDGSWMPHNDDAPMVRA